MLINFKKIQTKAEWTQVALTLHERLPMHITSPCVATCGLVVEKQDKYFLLQLEIDAPLTIICQRCLNAFCHHFHHALELAVTHSDKMADVLMKEFECIVMENHQINLVDLITDELHLYTPQTHADDSDCDQEMAQFICAEEGI